MRRVILLSLITLAGGRASIASERGGKVVRVEKRVSQVLVGAGTFMMGVEPPEDATQLLSEDISQERTLVEDCLTSFPGVLGIHPISMHEVQFCEQTYQRELEHMRSRAVYLDAFLIDRDEVSVADYRRCVASGQCSLDALVSGDERYIRADWPLVNVTWDEARIYCAAQGGRLPTEAEWERTARGGDGRTWPWGNVARPRDWNHGQARNATMRALDANRDIPVHLMGDPDDSDGAPILAPIGQYPWGEGANGVRDLAGSVAEWTADMYVSNTSAMGYETHVGGRLDQGEWLGGAWLPLPAINPVRDAAGGGTVQRVVRGGSWRQPAFLGKSFARDPFNLLYEQNRRFAHIGFRCVKPAR